jgi:superfamily I DNA and/or RNA helicase
MNQAQRNFLIKKIEESIKNKIKALDNNKPEPPSLNNYLLHAVMSGNFNLRSTDEIKKTLTDKALKAKGNEDWLGNRWGMATKNNISFTADEIFIIPEEYKILFEQFKASTTEINQKIHDISVQGESLITRIQLASDKTLQTVINEIDDMGNISLMDTKLKLLSNG